jgi:putative FmdB family regulatory protein
MGCIKIGEEHMPIVEYKCQRCDHTFENVEFSEEDKPTYCADCMSADTLVRVFPLPSKPQFKGKGFYETDYKKKTD